MCFSVIPAVTFCRFSPLDLTGADDVSTKSARASVRRVELSLQPGHADTLTARPEHVQHIALMPQRDMRLPYMGSRAGQRSRGGASPGRAELSGLEIRSVSREKVLLHNRPESMMSSAYSLQSASERLLASRPLSSKSKGSRVTSATSSALGTRGTSMSVAWSSKTAPVEVRLDLDEEVTEMREEGAEGAGPGTSTPRGAGRGGVKPRTVMVDLDLSKEDDVQPSQQTTEGQQHSHLVSGCRLVSLFVTWCFDRDKLQRIISGLMLRQS